MSADMHINRRAFVGGSLIAPLAASRAYTQGFAGLGSGSDGFAEVVAGKKLEFPRDHGPHPDYRIEWWYLTADLTDAAGEEWGAQWTLFRQAMAPGVQQEGWANQQIWMGHAAVTSASVHRYSENSRAGVSVRPALKQCHSGHGSIHGRWVDEMTRMHGPLRR
jgi:predicted secreted hydrolase